MNIQQAARVTGLGIHTLRYYEKIGLIPDICRNSSGHRDYMEKDLAWIEFLNRLKATGMSLAEMKRFAVLREQGDDTVSERRQMLEIHQASIEAAIEIQLKILEKIREKILIYKNMEKNTAR